MVRRHTLSLIAAASLALAGPAFGVHDDGLFELDLPDANPQASSAPGDDWQNLFSGGTTIPANFIVSTDVPIPDPAPKSIFTGGGSKDIRDVSAWLWKDGSVPDKDNLTNAYAAAYKRTSDGHLIFYFGADRFSNDGDAQMGFWFFQNQVSLSDRSGGGGFEFNGTHRNGDILVLVNFSGGGDTPTIEVFEWDGGVKDNLIRLVAPTQAKCGGGGSDTVCAVTNDTTTPASPWAYVPKPNVGSPGIFPHDSFFEGGLDISTLFPGTNTPCFSSFLAETRSSTSATSQLKDFVLGAFPVCKVELSKVCRSATLVVDPTGDKFVADYTVTVKNEGFATVNSIVATDDNCTAGNTSDDDVLNLGPIAEGGSDSEDGQCVVPATNVSTLINRVSAVADGGDVPVVIAGLAGCNGGSEDSDHDGVPDTCAAVCPISFSRAINVTKRCVTSLFDAGDKINVRVLFAGEVTNTGAGTNPEPLIVSVSDDKAGGPLQLKTAGGTSLGTSTRLNPGDSAFFESFYDPSSVNSTCPEQASFMDTVTATGTGTVTGTTVADTDTATCELCPGNCPAL